MTSEIVIAMIAAIPPTLAAILGFLGICCGPTEDVPDLLKVERDTPLTFLRRIYHNQRHEPLLAQELWSRADPHLFTDRRTRPEPDRLEIVAVRIRELAARSEPV